MWTTLNHIGHGQGNKMTMMVPIYKCSGCEKRLPYGENPCCGDKKTLTGHGTISHKEFDDVMIKAMEGYIKDLEEKKSNE